MTEKRDWSDRNSRKTARRIPNKVGWALDHIIMVLLRCLISQWLDLMDYAERKSDIVLSGKLGRSRHTIAEIERVARNARDGRYEEE